MNDWNELIDSLPDPTKDEMPPMISWTDDGREQWEKDNEYKKSLLDVKNDTEERVKYALSSVADAKLQKDGDFITVVGGKGVWRKKTADYVGSVPFYGAGRLHTYVEVKGISPGNNFQLSRLDKRNNPKQPSQHEKLTEVFKDGNVVWLALGFWDAADGRKPIVEERNDRRYNRWLRGDVELTIYTIPWFAWLDDILPNLKFRSLRQQDRWMIDGMSIYKVGSRWTLHPDHWLHTFRGQKRLF